MHLATAPARMVTGWVLFPILLALSAIVGAGLGWFSGWASTAWDDPVPWLYLLGLSPALWVLCTAGVGMTTNSWIFAALFGMTCTFVGRISAYVTTTYLVEDRRWLDWTMLTVELPLAVLAGAILGWAGSAWRHDEGIIRAVGGALIAGVLLWNGWVHLADDVTALELVTVRVGWSLVAAAAFVTILTGSLRNFVVAAAGAGAVMFFLRSQLPSNAFFTGPVLSDLATRIRDLAEWLLGLLRR